MCLVLHAVASLMLIRILITDNMVRPDARSLPKCWAAGGQCLGEKVIEMASLAAATKCHGAMGMHRER